MLLYITSWYLGGGPTVTSITGKLMSENSLFSFERQLCIFAWVLYFWLGIFMEICKQLNQTLYTLMHVIIHVIIFCFNVSVSPQVLSLLSLCIHLLCTCTSKLATMFYFTGPICINKKVQCHITSGAHIFDEEKTELVP